MSVTVALTAAELVVAAEELGLAATFAVGERSPEELLALRLEGWRSLVARGYARRGETSPEISSGFLDLAEAILRPDRVLSATRIQEDEPAVLAFVLVKDGRFVSATPVDADVGFYADVSEEQIVSALSRQPEANEGVPFVCEVRALEGEDPSSEVALGWTRTPDERLFATDGESATEVTLPELVQRLSELVDGSAPAGRT